MKKIIVLMIVYLSFLVSCSTLSRSYVVVDDIMKTNRIIAINSFIFPKDMTNSYYDYLTYLNTQVYADYVLKSFISNFNNNSEFVKLVTLEDAIGKTAFANLKYHYIVGSQTVAATGTLATNLITEDVLDMLLGKGVDGIMNADAYMSFWAQHVKIEFDIYNLTNTKMPIWADTVSGNSYYIIGDSGGPTKQTAYNIIIADVLKSQERHLDDLLIIMDQAISNGVSKLKVKSPYAFNTNSVIYTKKTFSLTNEEYSKKAGIN